MAYKSVEADKNGRVVIYPSLYKPRERGCFRSFKGLIRKLLSSWKKRV